jgi:hypothetical protein
MSREVAQCEIVILARLQMMPLTQQGADLSSLVPFMRLAWRDLDDNRADRPRIRLTRPQHFLLRRRQGHEDDVILILSLCRLALPGR